MDKDTFIANMNSPLSLKKWETMSKELSEICSISSSREALLHLVEQASSLITAASKPSPNSICFESLDIKRISSFLMSNEIKKSGASTSCKINSQLLQLLFQPPHSTEQDELLTKLLKALPYINTTQNTSSLMERSSSKSVSVSVGNSGAVNKKRNNRSARGGSSKAPVTTPASSNKDKIVSTATPLSSVADLFEELLSLVDFAGERRDVSSQVILLRLLLDQCVPLRPVNETVKSHQSICAHSRTLNECNHLRVLENVKSLSVGRVLNSTDLRLIGSTLRDIEHLNTLHCEPRLVLLTGSSPTKVSQWELCGNGAAIVSNVRLLPRSLPPESAEQTPESEKPQGSVFYYEVTLRSSAAKGAVSFAGTKVGWALCGTNAQCSSNSTTSASSRLSSAASGSLNLGQSSTSWVLDVDSLHLFHNASTKATERKPVGQTPVSPKKVSASLFGEVEGQPSNAEAEEEDDSYLFNLFDDCPVDLPAESLPVPSSLGAEDEVAVVITGLVEALALGNSISDAAAVSSIADAPPPPPSTQEEQQDEDDGFGFMSLFDDDEDVIGPVVSRAEDSPALHVSPPAATENADVAFESSLRRMLEDRGILSQDEQTSSRAVNKLFGVGGTDGQGTSEGNADIRKALLRHFSSMKETGTSKTISVKAKSPLVSSSQQPAVISKADMALKCGGDPLVRSDRDSSASIALSDGVVIGCALDEVSGEMTFFVDGVLLGTAPMLLTGWSSGCGVTPAVSSGSASASLEINIGQTPFKFSPNVTLALEAKSSLNDMKVSTVQAVIGAKLCSFLSLGCSTQLKDVSVASPGSNKGSGVVLSNFVSDAFKTMTFEATVRLRPLCNSTADVANSSVENSSESTLPPPCDSQESFVLFSCFPSSSNTGSGATSLDGGCQLGVNLDGSVFFELNGYVRVKSAPGVVVPGETWHHISVVYAFHRSTSKSNVVFVLNGAAHSTHDVVVDRNCIVSISSSKVAKVIPRTVVLGGLLGTSRNTVSSSNSWMGDIAEARVWSSERTVDDIARTVGRAKITSEVAVDNELLVCIAFEECSGRTLHDITVKNIGSSACSVRPTENITLCGSFEWKVLHTGRRSLDTLSLDDILHSKETASDDADKSFSEVVEHNVAAAVSQLDAARDLAFSLVRGLRESCRKYLFDGAHETEGKSMPPAAVSSEVRQLQHSTASVSSIVDPSETNLLVISSALRQCVAGFNQHYSRLRPLDERDLELLVESSAALLDLLRVNFTAILESKSALRTVTAVDNTTWRVYEQIAGSHKIEISSKIWSLCLFFVSGCDAAAGSFSPHSAPGVVFVSRLRALAVSTITAGLSLLVPSTDNQLFLLECLLMKSHAAEFEPPVRVDPHSKKAPAVGAAAAVATTNCNEMFVEALTVRSSCNGSEAFCSSTGLLSPDALVSLFSLSGSGCSALLNALCISLAQPSSITELMYRRVWPVVADDSQSVSSFKAISDVHLVRPKAGDIVTRGPHWHFEQQDGGVGSHGTVIEVVSWLEEAHRGVVVQWQSGSINTYRYGASSNSDHGVGATLEYDVSIMLPGHVAVVSGGDTPSGDAKASSPRSTASGVSGKHSDFPRKQLQYTPAEVKAALSSDDHHKHSGSGQPPLTKRVVLLYMKNNSPPEWQEKHDLLRSLNTLILKLNGSQVISLFAEFHATFSASPAPSSTSTGKFFVKYGSIAPRTKGKVDVYVFFEDRILRVLRCLSADRGAGADDGAVRFIVSVQAVLVGALGSCYSPSASLNATSALNVAEKERYTVTTAFKGRDGSALRWNWSSGAWNRASDGALLLSPSTHCSSSAQSTTVQKDGSKVLTDLQIDCGLISDSITVAQRSHSLDITQAIDPGSEEDEEGREWNSCIVNNCAMPPHTGTYCWYVTFKNIRSAAELRNSNSMCMVGVSTESVPVDDFLGSDSESWGLSSSSLDLFHSGRKKRTTSASASPSRLAVTRSPGKLANDGSSVLEVRMDTDKGALSFRLLGREPEADTVVTGYDNLAGVTVYPAFSLFIPGDCVSIFTSLPHIEAMKTRSASPDSSLLMVDTAKACAVGPAPLNPRPVVSGSPQPLLIEHSLQLMACAQKVLDAEVLDEESVMSDAIIMVCLPQALASLCRFKHPVQQHKRTDLLNASISFVDSVKKTVNRLRLLTLGCDVESMESRATHSAVEVLAQLSCLLSTLVSQVAGSLVSCADRGGIDNQLLARQQLHSKRSGDSLYVSSSEHFPYNALTGMPAVSQASVSAVHSTPSKTSNSSALVGCSWTTNKLFRRGYRGSGDGSAMSVEAMTGSQLLRDILHHHKSAEQLLRWVAVNDKTHRNYARIGGDELDQAVRAVFVCNIYHSGFSHAVHYASTVLADYGAEHQFSSLSESARDELLLKLKPPFFLSQCYEFAVKTRMWAREIVKSSGLSFPFLNQRVLRRVHFLFELEQAAADQTFAKVSSDVFAWAMLQHKAPVGAEKRFVAILNSVKTFVGDSSSLDHLRARFLTARQFAVNRVSGFKVLRRALENVSREIGFGSKLALFSDVANAMKGVGSGGQSRSHYLHGLDGIHSVLRSEVQAAFSQLFSSWTEELGAVAADLNSDVGGACYSLSLIDCCAVQLLEEDHALLMRINFFHSLEELLSNRDGDDRQLTVHGRELQSSVSNAALKLFIFTALQVAMCKGEPNDGKNNSIGLRSSLSLSQSISYSAMLNNGQSSSISSVEGPPVAGTAPLQLKRVQSGPATLSKSVFDILLQKLSEAVDAAWLASRSHKSDEAAVTLDSMVVPLSKSNALVIGEATMLLLCVAEDPTCQRILVQPKWLLLLLRMTVIKYSVGQQRALLLLSLLLPLLMPGELALDSDSISAVLGDTAGSPAERLIWWFLHLTGNLLLTESFSGFVLVCDAADPLRELSEFALPVVSEAIALVRTLFCSANWAATVERILLESVVGSGGADRAVLVAALCVLGGHVDALYKNCLVSYEAPINPGAARYMGVFVDYADASTDRLTVRPAHSDDSSAATTDSLVLSMDKVWPLSRCAVEKMALSPELVGAIVDVSERLVFQPTDTASSTAVESAVSTAPPAVLEETKEEEVQLKESKEESSASDAKSSEKTAEPEPQEALFCPLAPNSSALVAATCSKLLSNIATNPHTLSVVLSVLMNRSPSDSSSGILYRLLSAAQRTTQSSGLPDIPVYEEYLVAALQQRQKQHLLALKQKQMTARSMAAAAAKAERSPSGKSDSVKDCQGEDLASSLTASNEVSELSAQLAESKVGTERSSGFIGLQLNHSWDLGNSEPVDDGALAHEAAEQLRQLELQQNTFLGEAASISHQQMVDALVAMGFQAEYAMVALDLCGDDMDEALSYILNNGAQLDEMVINMNRDASQRNEGSTSTGSASGTVAATDNRNTSQSVDRANRVMAESSFGGSSLPQTTNEAKPTGYHCTCAIRKFIPYYQSPSFFADRVGGLHPGDDLHVLEEMVTDSEGEHGPGYCRVWYKLSLSEVRQEMPALDTIGSETLETFVYVPKYYQSVLLVEEGPANLEDEPELESPPGFSIPISRTYRVVGSSGALVRAGWELGTDEIRTVPTGGIVTAVEETFNSEGTLRLRITSPVAGWISKLPKLLVLECSDEAASPAEEAIPQQKPPVFCSELEEFRATVPDRLEENWLSNEGYAKEDRFFGSRQGALYDKFSAVDGSRRDSASTYNRRVRITGGNSVANIGNILSTWDAAALNAKIAEILSVLGVLHARKTLLALLLKNSAGICSLPASSPMVPSLLARLVAGVESAEDDEVVNSGDSGSETSSEFPNAMYLIATKKTHPASWLRPNSAFDVAVKLANFVRLLVFRGDPFTHSGLEWLAFDDLAALCMQVEASTAVSLETVLGPALLSVLRHCDNKQLSRHLESILVEFVAQGLRLASGEQYGDHFWGDAAYDEDTDDELVRALPHIDAEEDIRPNVNYLQWLTLLLLQLNKPQVSLSLFKIWTLALRSSCFSLKHLAFSTLASMLRISFSNLDLLQSFVEELPVARLSLMARRRLWYEMEDAPLYSRLLQSLLDLVAAADNARQILERVSTDGVIAPNLAARSVLVFGATADEVKQSTAGSSVGGSYLEVSPAKDLAVSWTLECWVRVHDDSACETELVTVDRPSDSEPTEVSVLTTSPPTVHTETIKPMYLMSSDKAYVMLRAGGTVVNHPLLLADTNSAGVTAAAHCVSLGLHGSSEVIFDHRLTTGEWTHVAIAFDKSTNSATLLINGSQVDAVTSAHFVPCPLHIIGNSKVQRTDSSFCGELAGLRVFGAVRTEKEVRRDMDRSSCDGRYLQFSILCNEGRNSVHTFDSVGVVNPSVELHHCRWEVCGDAPWSKPPVISEFITDSRDELCAEVSQDCLWEFTGILKLSAEATANPGDVLSSNTSEVVTLCFRVDEIQSSEQQFTGFLHWSERAVRSVVAGSYCAVTGDIAFSCGGDSTVIGSPETLSWLQTLSFKGSVLGGSLEGKCSVSALISGQPELLAGTSRLDKHPLLTSSSLKYETAANPVSGGLAETLTVRDVEEGQYVATVQVKPHTDLSAADDLADDSDVTSYGLCANQGCMFLEWQVQANVSDSIVFGLCTALALSHPDSCVEANDETWTYSVAGQASHGVSELHLCGTAGEGDLISVQIDTQSEGGSIRFYRNYQLLVSFFNINAHPQVSNDSSESRGIRPFVSLVSAKDSVSYLGAKESGDMCIFFPEDDSLRRVELNCPLCRGAFNGYGILSVLSADGVAVEKWFGLWSDNLQHGCHILVQSKPKDSSSEQKASVETVDADKLPEAADSSGESTPALPSRVIFFDKGVVVRDLDNAADTLTELEAITSVQAEHRKYLADHDFSAKLVPPVSSLASAVDALPVSLLGDGEDDSAAITISVWNGCGPEPDKDVMRFKVARSASLNAVFDRYAKQKFAQKARYFGFTLNEVEVDGSLSSEGLSWSGQEVVLQARVHFLNADLVEPEEVDLFVEEAEAPYVIQVIYEPGATARSTVEIEDSNALRTVECSTVVESFSRRLTYEGIGRFQLADGAWISERLRGGTESQVVQVLRERFEKPLKYRVARGSGAKVRKQAVMDSEEVGFVPQETELVVSEARYVIDTQPNLFRDEAVASYTRRLKIEAPEEWRGWASDKPHLLTLVTAENTTEESAALSATLASADATTAAVDPIVQLEISRRQSVVARRRALQSQRKSAARLARGRRAVETEGTISASRDTFFLLNKTKSTAGSDSTSLAISEDCTTVTCNDGGCGRVMVLGSRGFTSGVHYWEVTVNSANWGSVFIGVCIEDTSGWNGYGLLNYRATQCYGSETLYGSYYSVGDKVGVLLDMDRGTVSFLKDGEDFNVNRVTVTNMGVAYHNLRKQAHSRSYNYQSCNTSPRNDVMLFPCLGVKSAGDSLSLLNSHWSHEKGTRAAAMVAKVLQANQLVQQWRGGLRLAETGVSANITDTHCVDVMTRAGLVVKVDTSVKAFLRAVGTSLVEKYNLSVGKPFRSVYGPATIIGSRHGSQLWYNYSGDSSNKQSNWYWRCSEVEELVSSGIIRFEGSAAEEGVSTVPDQVAITSEEISTARGDNLNNNSSYDAAEWTALLDEDIVAVANFVASKQGASPMHLQVSDLLAAVSGREKWLSLRRRDPNELFVRYKQLCQLNAAVALLLPFADFNEGDNRTSAVRTDNPHFSWADSSAQSVATRSGLCTREAVLAVKALVFTQTKLDMWQAIVRETTTSTSAAADEYERPDDVTEMVINRLEARNAEKSKDSLSFGEKLRVSVFGQLLTAMKNSGNFSDSSAFRRSFVHIQDGNQSRAFYVKFAGEGVDDNGGPYRAVFQTALGEEVLTLLELLVPCPNAQGEVGENRDKFVLNSELLSGAVPETTRAQVTEVFTYLGKLVGLACRQSILSPLSLPGLFWKPLAGERVTVQDLAAIDSSVVSSLRYIQSAAEEDPASVTDLLAHALQMALSLHGSDISGARLRTLVENAVTSSQAGSQTGAVDRLVELVQQLHLTAHSEGLKAVHSGLSATLPVEVLSVFGAKELEVLFCGEDSIDLDTLRRATVYDESTSASDPHIQFLWSSLEEMNGEERAQFVNFCSGRSRLPPAASEFPMPFKLVGPPAHSESSPDQYLPIARTCFFSLSLPKYSSKEVCLQKLRYAVKNTELMDADFIDRKGASGWENIR